MAKFDHNIVESVRILKKIDDLDWSKYKQYKPIYVTEKKSREHHEGYIMDKTFFTQHLFFKMYEKSGD